MVIRVNFTPKYRKRIADLKLDPKKYRTIVDDHVIGVLYYVNDEEGITYQVQSGRIDSVEYHPTKRDEHLYCGEPVDEKQRPVRQATLLPVGPSELRLQRTIRVYLRESVAN